MRVQRLSLLDGARRATGVAVIIDVYRAFTTAAVAFQRGAKQIVLVDSPQAALVLRRQGIGDLIMGEEGGKKAPSFDFGNSPYELSQADVAGNTLIQSTSAGTKGVVAAAAEADTVYAVSLVNAAATVKAILARNPDEVSIVAMGNGGKEKADEDEACALYIQALFEDKPIDLEAMRASILAAPSSARFGDPKRPHFHLQDREIALQVDSIPLAMPVQRIDGMLVATGVDQHHPHSL